MTFNLCCIIEGHGEEQAVPVLVRRIQQSLRPDIQCEVKRLRVPRHKMVKPHELERAVEFASRLAKPPRAILILVDADEDPPCLLGPKLLQRAKAARPDVSIGVVLAKREFETWFLAAIESLRGRRGLPDDLQPIPDVENVQDAKGRLTDLMAGSEYTPPFPTSPHLRQRLTWTWHVKDRIPSTSAGVRSNGCSPKPRATMGKVRDIGPPMTYNNGGTKGRRAGRGMALTTQSAGLWISEYSPSPVRRVGPAWWCAPKRPSGPFWNARGARAWSTCGRRRVGSPPHRRYKKRCRPSRPFRRRWIGWRTSHSPWS